MGSISKRTYDNGVVRYRVQLKKFGKGSISITFDDYDAACDWLDKHDAAFRENPEYYFEWREKLISECRRKQMKVLDHIVCPRLQGKKLNG